MTLEEAKDFLRVDQDNTDNDTLINGLLEAIPDYIEIQTGIGAEQQKAEPMAKTVTGFILQLWYFGESADDLKLKRTIDSLLKCLTLKRG